MVQVINPTTVVKVVPKEGELEIHLNIHITLEGKVIASSEGADVQVEKRTDDRQDEDAAPLIPTFSRGTKILNFSKE